MLEDIMRGTRGRGWRESQKEGSSQYSSGMAYLQLNKTNPGYLKPRGMNWWAIRGSQCPWEARGLNLENIDRS